MLTPGVTRNRAEFLEHIVKPRPVRTSLGTTSSSAFSAMSVSYRVAPPARSAPFPRDIRAPGPGRHKSPGVVQDKETA